MDWLYSGTLCSENPLDTDYIQLLTSQLFLLFIGGMVVGPIFDTHGSKALMISGTLIYVLSVMFTSLSSELYQFILAQGIMFGIGDTMLCDTPFSNHV